MPNHAVRRWPALLAIATMVAAGLIGGVASYSASSPREAHAAGPLVAGDTSIADVTERVLPSVVNISTSKAVKRGPASVDPFYNHPLSPFGSPDGRRAASMGSGVIISADGTILTNNHVVSQGSAIKVTLADGRDFAAKLVGADPKSDLAVLKLQGNFGRLQPLEFGDSSKLRLGDVVLAIGNPFGVGQTVTMGIVSAKGRGNMGIVDYEDFIQTDAAINPGNSGGALVNMNGELVGVNTAILSRTGGYQGIGFAIPSNMAQPIMKSLVASGRVDRGWLGVSIRTIDSELAREEKLSVAQGVLIAEVMPDTPAAKQGLRAGDVVVAIDGKKTIDMSQLRNRVAMAGANATVRLDLVRGTDRKQVVIKLGKLPGDN